MKIANSNHKITRKKLLYYDINKHSAHCEFEINITRNRERTFNRLLEALQHMLHIQLAVN